MTPAVQCLSTLSTDSAGQLDVLWHDGDTLGVDGAQVGVFKQADQVSFAGFLQSHDSRALETQVGFEILGDFTHQTLEGQLADQQFSALLVTTDFTESHCARPVTMGLLHSSSGRGTLTSSLGGQLFARSLPSCGLAGGLLCTSHCSAAVFLSLYSIVTLNACAHRTRAYIASARGAQGSAILSQ